MIELRLQKLEREMGNRGLDAVAVNAGPMLSYLSGLQFHLSERPVVMVFVPGGEPTIVLPELEQAKLEKLAFSVRVFPYGEDPNGWGEVFGLAISELGLPGGKIGVEPRQMRLLEYRLLENAVTADFIDCSPLFAALRARKGSEELAMLRRAVHIAEAALEATLPSIGIGVSEKEIAAELFLQLIRHGSDPVLPFSPIVAAGPNSADPHAVPSERPLAAGDLLIVDWGANYNGYMSDLTRTFAVGTLDAEAEKIHRVVEQANLAGRQAGGPGTLCAEVDRAARRCIEEAGYGRYFTHRTGHGLGMECHEDPYIQGANRQPLAEDMVYTVEPGIYLPGRNGVRIEDDVVVTKDGVEVLSTMERGIRNVG